MNARALVPVFLCEAPLLSLLLFFNVSTSNAQTFENTNIELNSEGIVIFSHQTNSDSYYVLRKGSSPLQLVDPVSVQLGTGEIREHAIVLKGEAELPLFFQSIKIPITSPLDTDGDGIHDVFELERPSFLNPLNRNDAALDSDNDGVRNLDEFRFGSNLETADPFPAKISSLSPANGESLVSPIRNPVVRFDKPLLPESVTANSIRLEVNGSPIPTDLELSPSGLIVTVFPDISLPSSTEIALIIDGDQIRSTDSIHVDADGDLLAGGFLETRFRTLPLTRIPNTNVFGYVRDSFTGDPIEGATIEVDAFPLSNATTNPDGRFELVDMPAPEFFVHVNGQTANNVPTGFGYPSVGKPFHSVAGQTTQIAHHSEVFDIFLPLMATGDIIPLNANGPTDVGFGPNGLNQLAGLFPGISSSMWESTKVEFPPGSAVDDAGNPVTEGVLIPVPADRIPAPLPSYMEADLVISIQAPGATRFATPAPVSLPNVNGLPPGSKSLIMSFDHSAGKWIVSARGTVSQDGTVIVSDPGQGILAPGWHTGQFATDPEFPSDDNCDDVGVEDVIFEWWDTQTKQIECAMELLPDKLVTTPIKAAATVVSQSSDYIDAITAITESSSLSDPAILENTLTILSDAKALATVGADAADEIPIVKIVSVINCLASFSKEVLELSCLVSECFFNAPQIQVDTCTILKSTVDSLEFATDKILDFKDLAKGGPAAVVCAAIEAAQDAISGASTSANNNRTVTFSESVFISDISIEEEELIRQKLTEVVDAINVWRQEAEAYQEWESAISRFLADYEEYSDSVLSVVGARGELYRDAYYLVTIDGFEFRGKSSSLGAFDLPLLSPDTDYVFEIFDPASGLLAVSTGHSAAAGSPTLVPDPIIQLPNWIETSGDSDGDGLSDAIEQVIGTSSTNPDTDDDGATDGVEVENGLNPLDGVGFATGIVGNVQLQGEAWAVTIDDDLAYVATGKHGLAIVDIANPQIPLLIAELDLSGANKDIAIDPESKTVAISSRTDSFFVDPPSVHFIDVSTPSSPELIRSHPATSTKVEFHEGIFYATDGGRIDLFESSSTQMIAALDTGSFSVTDIALKDGILVTAEGARLRTYDTNIGNFTLLGSINIPGQANAVNERPLAVDGELVYVGGRSGYTVFDIADPANPLLVGELDTNSPFIQDIAIAGSNRLLTLNTPLNLSVNDSVDPTVVNDVIVSYNTLRNVRGLALTNGWAFVADDSFGLTVVRYLGGDNGGIAPSIGFDVNVLDQDTNQEGIQVMEGARISLSPIITDDQQVETVEVLVDGTVLSTRVDGGTELFVNLPTISTNISTATIQVRSEDTAGNVTSTDEFQLELIPDTDSAEIVHAAPAHGSAGITPDKLVLLANRTIDFDTIDLSKISVSLSGQADPFPISSIELSHDRFVIVNLESPLATGQYELSIAEGAWTDLLGYQVPNDTISFSSYDVALDTSIWISDIDGNFSDPENWLYNVKPTSRHDVLIDRPNSNPIVTYNSGSSGSDGAEINESLIVDATWTVQGEFHSTSNIELRSGIFQLTENSVFEGPVKLTGSDFIITKETILGDFETNGGTLVLDGINATVDINGTITQGDFSIESRNGAIITLPWVISLGENSPNGILIKARGAGASISLPNLESITPPIGGGGIFFSKYFSIEAWNGGQVSLPALATIPQGRVNLYSRYEDSTIEIPLVTSLVGPTDGNVSTVQSLNSGMINFGSSDVTTSRTAVTLDDSGAIFSASLTLGTEAILRGNGQLQANLINGGEVQLEDPASIEVDGSFTQTNDGRTLVSIGINGDPTLNGTLNATGISTLDGILEVSPNNSYNPQAGHNFPIMTFSSKEGNFATIEGTSLNNGLTASLSLGETTAIINVIAP